MPLVECWVNLVILASTHMLAAATATQGSPRGQHSCVIGSHSPLVQHVSPHANWRLQQPPPFAASPLGVYTWAAEQQMFGPARSLGQHAPWGGAGRWRVRPHWRKGCVGSKLPAWQHAAGCAHNTRIMLAACAPLVLSKRTLTETLPAGHAWFSLRPSGGKPPSTSHASRGGHAAWLLPCQPASGGGASGGSLRAWVPACSGAIAQ